MFYTYNFIMDAGYYPKRSGLKIINLNDGTIVKVEFSGDGKLCLIYLDWKNELKKLLFSDVIYLELLYAGLQSEVEIGDFLVTDNDKKIFETGEKLGESTNDYKLFKVMDPWAENKLVEIIAKKVELIIDAGSH